MSLTARQSLPASLQQPLQQLVSALETHSSIESLILYGGVLRGRYQPSSDVNLLIVLKDSSPAALCKLEIPLTEARRNIRLTPMLLDSSEIARVADVFPVKMLDIQRHHLVLHGLDRLSEIRVEPEHVRLHLEQGLRNLQLRLRARLAGQAHDGLSLRKHLQTLARPLAIHLLELMNLVGLECTADKTLAIFEAAARHWNLSATALQQLGGIREETLVEVEPAQLAGEVLELLRVVVALADAWEVPACST